MNRDRKIPRLVAVFLVAGRPALESEDDKDVRVGHRLDIRS